MTSVHFASNYPIWPLWDLIAWEPWIPFSSKQGMLLFAAATIRHTDRKQILIIVWTHRGKKYHLWVTVKWVSIAKLQNTVVLCVRFPFPGMRLVLWLEVGLGRWMTSPVGLTFEFWHSGTLCSLFNPPPRPPPQPPCHLLSEAWIVLSSAFSFPPQRIPPFLFLLLSSCLRMKWRKWHSSSHDEWYLTPGTCSGGAHTALHLHKPGDLTHALVYIREKQLTRTHSTAQGAANED